MRICYKAGNVTYNTNYYSVITDSVEIRIWFLTDEIIRIRAGFDGDWDEASYSLAMTAWDSRTDEFLKGYRKRVEVAYSELVDRTDKAVMIKMEHYYTQILQILHIERIQIKGGYIQAR